MTGQGQSEISEILGGRQVRDVTVLGRVAHGLGLPPAVFGLANGADPVRTRPIELAKPGPVVWTGRESAALRNARRMSVRAFAYHLGVSDRVVSKWEAGGPSIRPRPFNQAALDTSLARATPSERARFAAILHLAEEPVQPPVAQPDRYEVHVPINASSPGCAMRVAERIVASMTWLDEVDAAAATVSAVGEQRRLRVYNDSHLDARPTVDR
jgi:transcriptional regulator with XRE-family HTH domain